MLTPRISRACMSSASFLVTAAQVGVIVHRTHGGVAIPGTGHHAQSELSPPMRSVRPPYGARLRTICSNATSGSSGLVPTSFSTDGYSVASPTNPAGTAGPTAALPTVTVIGALASLAALAAGVAATASAAPSAARA